jgi:hypothetical protein
MAATTECEAGHTVIYKQTDSQRARQKSGGTMGMLARVCVGRDGRVRWRSTRLGQNARNSINQSGDGLGGILEAPPRRDGGAGQSVCWPRRPCAVAEHAARAECPKLNQSGLHGLSGLPEAAYRRLLAGVWMAETVVCGGGALDILLAATEGSRDPDGSGLWRAPRAASLKKLTPRHPRSILLQVEPLGGPAR